MSTAVLSENTQRHIKFSWQNLEHLPSIGKTDYHPKQRCFRMYETGTFYGEYVENFPIVKEKKKFDPIGKCIYCGKENDNFGQKRVLTSEHIIPEYLGAGVELPEASCPACQKITSEFENALAIQMFDPVRKAFLLQGKRGILKSKNFPLDIGFENSQYVTLGEVEFPTMLALPALMPASSYSRRPKGGSDIFNIKFYNVNANRESLGKYSLAQFSSCSIDTVKFSQMIAKIAHCYVAHFYRSLKFTNLLNNFVITPYTTEASCSEHFDNVGSILHAPETTTQSLHEIEVGRLEWAGMSYLAARVRLFACCDMPSYYVTVGI